MKKRDTSKSKINHSFTVTNLAGGSVTVVTNTHGKSFITASKGKFTEEDLEQAVLKSQALYTENTGIKNQLKDIFPVQFSSSIEQSFNQQFCEELEQSQIIDDELLQPKPPSKPKHTATIKNSYGGSVTVCTHQNGLSSIVSSRGDVSSEDVERAIAKSQSLFMAAANKRAQITKQSTTESGLTDKASIYNAIAEPCRSLEEKHTTPQEIKNQLMIFSTGLAASRLICNAMTGSSKDVAFAGVVDIVTDTATSLTEIEQKDRENIIKEAIDGYSENIIVSFPKPGI
jgi:hypothetical protein